MRDVSSPAPMTETGGKRLPSATAADRYLKTTVVYKTVGQLEIEATVYRNHQHRHHQESLRPAILWIHGGGLVFGTKEWLPQAQLDRYLEKDFVVVAIDHRLVPETKIPKIVQDVQDALHWMKACDGGALFHIDPNRIAVVGHSSGGYLALLTGTFPQKPKAIVSLYGFCDLTGDWTTKPNTKFNPHLEPISRAQALQSVGRAEIASDTANFDPEGRPKFFFHCKQQGSWVLEATGVDPQNNANAKRLTPYEPIRLVSSAYPPTLLMHGDKDTDVPVQQSIQFSAELQQHKVPTALIRNPEWPHLFDMVDDPEVQEALDQLIVFLQTHLQGMLRR
eukprot:scaffold34631_cov251-Amphora_coffeaeformis.AAC.4